MNFRDPEYEAFGPWAIEISEEYPPPPLFLPYLTRTETPLLSIKIPRKIERRSAVPGMNLYDYLVTLYARDMVILQRHGEEVGTHTFAYDDIQYLRHSEELLKGTLALRMTNSAFDLPFSTVSSDLMLRLVDLLVSRAARGTAVFEAGHPELAIPGLSFLFAHLAGLQEGYELTAVQADTLLSAYEANALRRLWYGASSKTLLESLHFYDGAILKIIDRGRRYKYRWQTSYGTRTTYMPAANITAAAWEEDAQSPVVVNLTLSTAGGSAGWSFLSDNPSIASYRHTLALVAEAARPAHVAAA